MSETTSNGGKPNDESSNQSESETFTVTLNGTHYALNEDLRRRIQTRAKHEYAGNPRFSCWWKVASERDAEDEDTVHERGDPILVIETAGPMVPWENLDQLELEEQTTDAFDEFDTGSDSGGGMKTVEPDDDESREKERTHFGITPQEFEEVPSPDGEDSDKVPAKPESFDEPSMVLFVPDHPDIEHSWGAGEALTPMDSWVEWNVQKKADQPSISGDKEDRHTHWESILQMEDCETVGEVEQTDESDDDILDKVEEGGDSGEEDDIPQHFKEGKYGGGNWNV